MNTELLNELAQKAKSYTAYENEEMHTWCGECGNYGIMNALIRALVLENIEPHQALFCFDIGCNGNGSDKFASYTYHGLHGRVLPLAAGAKIANPELTVLASAGDGAVLSEGVNHLVHTVRNDYPILFLLHDNQNYALTTGQPSSTTPVGKKMNCAPQGSPIETINPLQLVLSLDPSFVAQTSSSDVNHMTDIFRLALHHEGFAFISIRQVCPTYNKESNHEWHLTHAYKIETVANYDRHNIWDARKIVENPADEKFPIGLLYENKNRKNFFQMMGTEKRNLTKEVQYYDISQM